MDKVCRREFKENKRVIFPYGLIHNLEEVREKIKGMRPMPKIQSALINIKIEESQKRVTQGDKNTRGDNSSMVARGTYQSLKKSGRLWYEFCRKPIHTEENV